MRKILTFALILSFIFISCEKNDEPEEEKIQQDPNLTESTIGQSGGKLKTETFELIVPAGAFLSDNELKISEVDEESDFGENSNSGQYLIEGLPDELSKPLKIKIKYSGTPGESFIAASEEAMDAGTGEEDVFYDFLEGTDSAGFLMASYPPDTFFHLNPTASSYKSTQGTKWIKLEVVSNFISGHYTGTEKHTYDVFIRENLDGLRPEIIGYFDKAYHTYISTLKFKHDFYFDLLVLGNYKLNRILVSNVREDIYCKYLWKSGNQSLPGGLFVINAKKLDDPAGMQRMIASEVFRSILFQYDMMFPRMDPPNLVDHYWLNQSLITWSEEFFVPVGERVNYVPSGFKGNEMAALNGIDYGSNIGEGSDVSKVINYGRGLSPLVKFISMDNLSADIDTMWAYYYNSVIRKDKSPVAVVINMMNDAFNNLSYETGRFDFTTKGYYVEFLDQYLRGNIYSVEASTFLDAVSTENTFTINKEEDTLKLFSRNYPELSARLFKIEIKNDEIQKDRKLELKASAEDNEAAHVVVYGYKDGDLTLLEGGRTITISDLTPYDTYLAMVPHDFFSFLNINDIKLDLEVTLKKPKERKFEYCAIKTELKRIRESNYFSEPIPEPFVDTTSWVVSWYLKGSFNGNKFEAQIDTLKQGQENVTGGAEILLDDNSNLISLNVVAHFEGENGYKSTWGIDCSNMKPSYISDNFLNFNVTKQDACLHTDQITGYYEDNLSWDKTTGFLCDDRSNVIIKFTETVDY